MAPPRPASRPVILLLDLYEWTDAYPAAHPLRNVTGWFARHLPEGGRLELRTAGPQTDLDLALRARDATAVIISGSPRDAWVEDPRNDRVLEVIDHCRTAGKPLLGVCFGHQLLGRALGAPVGRHPGGYELGNVEVRLTDEGVKCPLFAGLPRRLDVLESHQDAVLEVPAGARLLATGAHTRVQAFDFAGHLLGVQFHPEMDPAVLQFVWGEPRRALWRPRLNFDLDARLTGLHPTPEAALIFSNFLNHYLP